MAVTEADWLDCTDPQKMLDFLRDKASDRKLTLLVCACCRSVLHLLPDERAAQVVEEVEGFAEGHGTNTEATMWTQHVAWEVKRAYRSLPQQTALVETANALVEATYGRGSARLVIGRAATAAGRHSGSRAGWVAECVKQCCLARCIVGNPFRPASLTPAVLAWNDATVVRLAQAAYEERHMPEGTLDNGRLAVLADALEEAGCADAEILGHLRGQGPHVRGCWVVDLLLGKE
jgi:hypothetical protein